ncbi:MAG: DUF4011 domain-containing protein [Clostridia bacterium]|nr:DUF4011 domain-containing protein [Clostridia bacterium]
MGKGIYTYYKERLIEIGGKNKCLYLKNIVRKGAYDIGRIFEGREDKVNELIKFLWSAGKEPLSLISHEETPELIANLGTPGGEATEEENNASSAEEFARRMFGRKKKITSEQTRLVEAEVTKLTELKREVEEIERETGKNDLYIGYPFVFGSIQQGPQKTLIKAPLMLFPVKIDIVDEETVDIRFRGNEKIQINKALILAYAQSKRMNVDELETEFDDLSPFRSLLSLIKYLGNARIRIDCKASKNIYNYSRFKEPEASRTDLSVRHAAVLGRFPLSNSIYNDYCVLEKKNLTNDAIDELLRTGGKFGKKKFVFKPKIKFKRPLRARKSVTKASYIVKMLDFAQSEVVKKVDSLGNMVIYGPPGTGKSQTIVNVITDALCKKKRVLVVSQKKAALDVVFSRLGTLNEKAMYVNDEGKQKHAFYERVYEAHKRSEEDQHIDIQALVNEYTEIQGKIDAQEKLLDDINHVLNDKQSFGLSLSDMYSSSYMLQKGSGEYAVYLRMIESHDLMALNYKELSDAMFTIRANNIIDTYYSYALAKEKNPIIDCMRDDIDIPTIAEVKQRLSEIQKSRKGFFNITKYPYTRQVLAHYAMLDNPATLHAVAKMECRLENPNPLFRGFKSKEIEAKMKETLRVIGEFVKEYDCLYKVMTKDGYISVIDNILRGNTSYIKLVHEALDKYIEQRDVSMLLSTLDKNMLDILNFAYEASRNYPNYLEIIEKIPVIRMYHEITVCEEKLKDQLAKVVDYPNISARIYKLKESQLAVSQKICHGIACREYQELYQNAEDAKDYLYQISKDKKHWAIRKAMEVYGSYIFSLFPCWLLSPENVSSLLPLEKNLFDIVIFDEASQVFIESTIPTIYRGKNIVVAGDAKQLRPSATFMKRFLGQENENVDDPSLQAALEVESLLDLAVARYNSANLTYHYRSRHQELIDFSNCAFYSGNLQVAPNIYTGRSAKPMERYKVNGRWIDRKNIAEAQKVVELIKNILSTRKHNESIGVITFNSDQQAAIADAIDKEAQKDAKFRIQIATEKTRMEGGEDIGLFIKNLENVQGDERDIIIFSIGYAPNETGKVYTNFGSLSTEGGENRLNVAITRAKTKIIVVTSIEPEDLKVDASKNEGPRLLREYLSYVRSVSNGDKEHAAAILRALCPAVDNTSELRRLTSTPSIEEQMKERIEKLGYKVDIGLGNKNSRISLAVYDDKSDKYLIGVELDKDAFASSASAMERDVYKPKFLEGRGWTVMRVWSRDWWLSPGRVVRSIVNSAEKNRTKGNPPKPIA